MTELTKDGAVMEIKRSTLADLPAMTAIYVYASRFMAEHGNPNQWGADQLTAGEASARGHRRRGQLCLRRGRRFTAGLRKSGGA